MAYIYDNPLLMLFLDGIGLERERWDRISVLDFNCMLRSLSMKHPLDYNEGECVQSMIQWYHEAEEFFVEDRPIEALTRFIRSYRTERVWVTLLALGLARWQLTRPK